MDAVSRLFPPLTNREVLTILAGCAVAIVVGIVLLWVPIQRRLRNWAAAQGYEIQKIQALSSYRRWFNTVWRVTVRSQAGQTRVALITFVGFEPFPKRLEVQWEKRESLSSS